jgi:hypothetical protein
MTTDKIKLEISVSLEDFFSNEQERSEVFREAMENAILRQLRDSEFVQKNIAYYLFDDFRAKIMKEEFDKIEEAVRAAVEEHKTPSAWSITSHEIYEKCIGDALTEQKDEIKKRAVSVANRYMDDESTDYGTFFDKIANMCVIRVFDTFVETMVKEKSK